MFGLSFGESGLVVAAWLRDSSMNHTGNVEAAAMVAEVLRKRRRQLSNSFAGISFTRPSTASRPTFLNGLISFCSAAGFCSSLASAARAMTAMPKRPATRTIAIEVGFMVFMVLFPVLCARMGRFVSRFALAGLHIHPIVVIDHHFDDERQSGKTSPACLSRVAPPSHLGPGTIPVHGASHERCLIPAPTSECACIVRLG